MLPYAMVSENRTQKTTGSLKGMNKAEIITSTIAKAGSKLVSVTFTKKDGTPRTMVFNRQDVSGIKGTGSPNTDADLIKVRDINLGQWRSFRISTVHQLKAGGQVWNFAA